MRNEVALRSRTGVRDASESLSSRQTETTAELIGWGPRSAIFLAWARSHTRVGQRLGPRPMLLFMARLMTLPPYTRTSEGEVHELGRRVRNGSHSARSDPWSEKRESIKWECPATSAEGTARCTSRGETPT